MSWTLPLAGPTRHVRTASVLLALMGAVAAAGAADYGGTGVVAPSGPPAGSTLFLLAASSGGYTVAGTDGWSLLSPFSFDSVTGLGSGSFSLTRGSDALEGTLSTAAGAPGTFELVYTVTTGSGAFAGATGGGSSVVTLLEPLADGAFRYAEAGTISVVPEPASWALMLGGAAWLAARRRAHRAHGGSVL